MVKRCFVAKCTSSRKNQKVSHFKAPNDKELLETWRKLVPLRHRELTSKDYICEKHFEKRYVVPRFQQSRFGDYYEDHIRPRLTPNAVPTIFGVDLNGKISSPLDNRNKLQTNVFTLSLPQVEVNDSDTVPICYNCLIEKCNKHHVFQMKV